MRSVAKVGMCLFLGIPGTPLLGTACATSEPATGPSVSHAWQQKKATPAQPPISAGTPDGHIPPPSNPGSSEEDFIATVNGHPILRKRLVDLLLRGHGPAMLEQLVVLELAERQAADLGLTITATDIDRERDYALRRLVDPLTELSEDSFNRDAAERLLDQVLAERNISREEFELTIRRNAALRRIVDVDFVVTDSQLRDEFRRLYGRRVEARHIQLATLHDVSRVKARLAAGEPFEDVAREYSANLVTRKRGGLLAPFSLDDEQFPAALRDIMGRLEPGAVSDAVRVGPWYHIMNLVRKLPEENVAFDSVKAELERRIRRRRAQPAMESLHEKLFRSASISIHDPVLREAFDEAKEGAAAP